jgi:hypothetical protein
MGKAKGAANVPGSPEKNRSDDATGSSGPKTLPELGISRDQSSHLPFGIFSGQIAQKLNP